MNAQYIRNFVAKECAIPAQWMMVGNNKTRVRARALAMWLTRDLLDYSYAEIGRIFRRDHTSVIHACQKVLDSAELSAEGLRIKGLLQSGAKPTSGCHCEIDLFAQSVAEKIHEIESQILKLSGELYALKAIVVENQATKGGNPNGLRHQP